jgi:sulfur transfer complex TusBCD TusB component (DsrH family)
MTTVLSLVSNAYRATIEEQDDTVLWLNHMLAASDIDVTVVLADNAVSYAVRGHDPTALRIGDVEVARPAVVDRDVTALVALGVSVRYVREDLEARGIAAAALVDGVEAISRKELADLMDGADHVWAW